MYVILILFIFMYNIFQIAYEGEIGICACVRCVYVNIDVCSLFIVIIYNFNDSTQIFIYNVSSEKMEIK